MAAGLGGTISLVVASVLGGIAGTSWTCLRETIQGLWVFMKNLLFLYVGKQYGLVEDSFDTLKQRVGIASVLQQAGLMTYQYNWQHEADSKAGNCIQHGYILLPSRSYCQAAATHLHLFNYVHVSHDATTIYYIGTEDKRNALLEAVDDAGNRILNDAAKTALLGKLGMNAVAGSLDARIQYLENRLAVLAILITIAVVVAAKRYQCPIFGCSFLFVVLVLVTAVFACDVVAALPCFGTGRLEHNHHKAHKRSQKRKSKKRETGNSKTETFNLVTPLLASNTWVPVAEDERAACSENAEVSTVSNENTYQEIGHRGYFYEVMRTKPFLPKEGTRCLQIDECPRAYAAPLVENFMHKVAHASIVKAEALLYVCLHNPCNETPVVEVRTPVEKVQNRCIQLLIVLPEILAFAHVLENGGSWRLRTNHNCSYVTNLSDFQHWLMGLSMSLPACDYSIIFPVAEEKPLQDCCVWKTCMAAFGDEACSVMKSVI